MRDVPGGGGGQCLVAVIGEDGVGKSSVHRVGLALHKTTVFEAGDDTRQDVTGTRS